MSRPNDRMRLRILLPTEILVDESVRKINADGLHGNFTLLPRHVDGLSALVPGLLSYHTMNGEERFAAVDGGLLIKQGDEVRVPTRRAVLSADLGQLRRLIAEEFLAIDERERHARSAVARLEVDFVRRLMELEDRVGA